MDNLNPAPAFNPQQTKKDEMTRELRKARNWILAVGLIMFTFDMVMVYAVYGDRLPSYWKTKILTYDLIILGFFVGMYILAYSKPVLACVLALCGFWGLHLYLATINPSSLKDGIIMKILFTVALINGIKSANNAEKLKKELEQVFA